MILDVNTVILFSAIIQFSNVLVMIYLRTTFNFKFYSYNSFITYFAIAGTSNITLLMTQNYDSPLFMMGYIFISLIGLFFLMNGFLEFFDKKSSTKLYAGYVLVFTILVHALIVAGAPRFYSFLLLIIHTFYIHSKVLYIALKENALKRNETQLILILNIFYIATSVVYLIILIIDIFGDNNFIEPIVFYAGANALTSLLVITGMIQLVINKSYKTVVDMNERLNLAQTISKTGSWELNLQSMEIWASEVAFEIYELDRKRDGMLPLDQVRMMNHTDDLEMLDKALYDLIEQDIPYEVEYRLIAANGKHKYIQSQAAIKKDKKGNKIKVFGVFRDITELKSKERELVYASYHDFLTGLHNRRFIDEEIMRLDTIDNLPFSIVLADLNNLKLTNDTFGHKQGDIDIVNAAKILKDSTRNGEIIARTGGDEFMLLLPNTSKEQTNIIIERITKNMQDFVYNEHYPFSMSIGYSTKTSIEDNIDTIFKEAEDNMYKDKIHRGPKLRKEAVDFLIKKLFEKDPLSEVHSRRVSAYVKIFAEELKLSKDNQSILEQASLVHDIGKVLLDDKILKSDKLLTQTEYDLMKEHSISGYRILNSISNLKEIAVIVLNHHERPDGLGYPQGIKDKDIPYFSKIIAICDAYESMTGHRLYKKPISDKDAINELIKNKGTQFDSKLVDTFVKLINSKRIVR